MPHQFELIQICVLHCSVHVNELFLLRLLAQIYQTPGDSHAIHPTTHMLHDNNKHTVLPKLSIIARSWHSTIVRGWFQYLVVGCEQSVVCISSCTYIVVCILFFKNKLKLSRFFDLLVGDQTITK